METRASVSEHKTTSKIAAALAIPEQKKPMATEEKVTAEIRGKEKLRAYMAQRTRASKNKDLFAPIDFGTEEQMKSVLDDADVAAYLEQNPYFLPAAIYAIEHNRGIGRIIKGKQTNPGMITVTNIPTRELNLADYGIDLDQLIEKHTLPTIKIGLELMLAGFSSADDIPVLNLHLTSGSSAEKEKARESEHDAIMEITDALFEKHETIYTGGDGQENLVKLTKRNDGPLPDENDPAFMALSDNVKKVIARYNGRLSFEILEFPDGAKFKERNLRDENHVPFGDSPFVSQKDKFMPDAGIKMYAGLAVKGGNTRNEDLLKTPLMTKLEHLATSSTVSDHKEASFVDKKKKIKATFSGGVSQEGPKKFNDPKEILDKSALILDENGNVIGVKQEALMACVEFMEKLNALVISNCARVALTQPDEKPVVDTIAIKEPKTSLGYMETFYKDLLAAGIDPFKAADALVSQFDFSNSDNIATLASALHKMGLNTPVSTPEEMTAVFNSANKYKLCLALRDTGIDPFKSEKDMMASFNRRNDDTLTARAKAINKLLQVQAIEPSEEKQAAFTSDLRAAFKKSIIELLKSDEFADGYHAYASETHKKTHGHTPRETTKDEEFAEKAEAFLAHANMPSDGGSGRSPWNRLSQKMIDMEFSGGFIFVAGKIPTADEMRVELLLENCIRCSEDHFEQPWFRTNVTETSTKGLGKQAEKPGRSAPQLYATTIMEYERFVKTGLDYVLSRKKTQEATQDSSATRTSPESSVAQNRYSLTQSLTQRPLRETPDVQDFEQARVDKWMGYGMPVVRRR